MTELLKQALELLTPVYGEHSNACTAIRAHLAAPAPAVPPGWKLVPVKPPVPFPACPECGDTAILYECVACSATNYPPDAKASLPVALSPLTEDQLELMWGKAASGEGRSGIGMYQTRLCALDFARAIEEYHGIKQGGPA